MSIVQIHLQIRHHLAVEDQAVTEPITNTPKLPYYFSAVLSSPVGSLLLGAYRLDVDLQGVGRLLTRPFAACPCHYRRVRDLS